MRISRNYKAEHWKALTFTSEADWQKAVDMFYDRLETRYLLHIQRLLRHSTGGFAVLTLDCALIETLQQFRKGTRKTPGGEVQQYFISFLTETSFSRQVDEELAKVFYKKIRCGLIHQAEVDSSLVKRSTTLPMIEFTKDRKGLNINATAFHTQLQQAINEYADMLRKPGSIEARTAFRTKMDFICGVEAKQPEAPK